MSLALLFAAGARATDGGKDTASQSRTMKKTKSGLQYIDELQGTGETPKSGPDLHRALHWLALGKQHQGQGVRQLEEAQRANRVLHG